MHLLREGKCDYFMGLFHLSRLRSVSDVGVDPEHSSQGLLLALVIQQAVKSVDYGKREKSESKGGMGTTSCREN